MPTQIEIKVDVATGELTPRNYAEIPRGAKNQLYLSFYNGLAKLDLWDPSATIEVQLFHPSDMVNVLTNGKVQSSSWQRDAANKRYIATFDTGKPVIGDLDLTTLFGRVRWNDPTVPTGDNLTEYFHVGFGSPTVRSPYDNNRNGRVNRAESPG